MENFMKNLSIKNCVFLLTFCLATTAAHSSFFDSDEEFDADESHCFVRNITKLHNNQWKIIVEEKEAYFITKEAIVELEICEGKRSIVRTKKEKHHYWKHLNPRDFTKSHIGAAVKLIDAVHKIKQKDIITLLEKSECDCQTSHK